MQKLFCILLLNLLLAGLPCSATESGIPVTAGLNHRYGIYFSSEEGSDLFRLYGSYLRFQMKVGIGATYDYYIKEGQRVTGRVESYNETAQERHYVLEHFFNGQHNAILKICDLPDCDNLKVALVYYADSKNDPTGSTLLEFVLNDDDFAPEIPQN